MTLAELKPGQRAIIDFVDTSTPEVIRLMVLGLIEGAVICIENAAIGGDPLQITVYGNALSLRRQQAHSFQVTPLSPGDQAG